MFFSHFHPAIVFVYDYYATAETLLAKHFITSHQMNGLHNNPFSMDSSARPFSSKGKGKWR